MKLRNSAKVLYGIKWVSRDNLTLNIYNTKEENFLSRWPKF